MANPPHDFREAAVEAAVGATLGLIDAIGANESESLSIAGSLLNSVLLLYARKQVEAPHERSFRSMRNAVAMVADTMRQASELETPAEWVAFLDQDRVNDARVGSSH